MIRQTLSVFALLSVLRLPACEFVGQRVLPATAHLAIPDGEVIVLETHTECALLVLTNQSTRLERMDYAVYKVVAAGEDWSVRQAYATQCVTSVACAPFYIGWSGAGQGKGYLYPGRSPFGRSQPQDLCVYRTRTNNLDYVGRCPSRKSFEKLERIE